MDEYPVDTTLKTSKHSPSYILDLANKFLTKIQLNMLPAKQSESIPNLTILAANPDNYRTVVSFNFDKVTNQCYWDKRILKYYTLIMRTTSIDKSFIGLRIFAFGILPFSCNKKDCSVTDGPAENKSGILYSSVNL